MGILASLARRGRLPRLRRLLAVVAFGAQISAVLAPLVDVRDACDPGPAIAVGISQPQNARLGSEQDHAPTHDSATCPACIVQSLHASPATRSALPAFIADEQTVVVAFADVLPHLDHLTTRNSRAPPVAD
ncbi:MAG TPA: hypothetical protein VHW65_07330 [Gemmatimonadales bacterium]|nr:hypothetical protein [Gemmatimonadales bacterium]